MGSEMCIRDSPQIGDPLDGLAYKRPDHCPRVYGKHRPACRAASLPYKHFELQDFRKLHKRLQAAYGLHDSRESLYVPQNALLILRRLMTLFSLVQLAAHQLIARKLSAPMTDQVR